jgi:hypothetical protein
MALADVVRETAAASTGRAAGGRRDAVGDRRGARDRLQAAARAGFDPSRAVGTGRERDTPRSAARVHAEIAAGAGRHAVRRGRPGRAPRPGAPLARAAAPRSRARDAAAASCRARRRTERRGDVQTLRTLRWPAADVLESAASRAAEGRATAAARSARSAAAAPSGGAARSRGTRRSSGPARSSGAAAGTAGSRAATYSASATGARPTAAGHHGDQREDRESSRDILVATDRRKWRSLPATVGVDSRIVHGKLFEQAACRERVYGGGAQRPPAWFANGRSSRLEITVPFGAT